MKRLAWGVVSLLAMAATALAEVSFPGRSLVIDIAPKSATAFEVPDKTETDGRAFGLHFTGPWTEQPDLGFFLNDLPVDARPVYTGDGWALRVPVGLIRPEQNSLRIEGAASGQLGALRLFSLEDSFEDIHFDLAFRALTAQTKAQPAPHPTQPKVDALHYDLTLRLNHANTNLVGTLVFTGRVLEDGLTTFALDFSRNSGAMAVTSLDSGPSTPAVPFVFSGNFLVMTLPRTYNAGDELVLRIAYSGVPATGGVFGAPYVRSTHGDPATPIIYTFSEPYGARFWWPCKDLPDDKAMIDLRLEAAKPYVVVSNGSLITREDRGATEVWHWKADFPIPTYLVAICSTNYEYVSDVYTGLDGTTTMEVGHYLFPQNLDYEAPGLAGTMDALDFMVATFGEYPFLDHKYTTATHLSGSGMEHTTMTSMPGRDVGVATGSAEPGKGRRNVHELAHHWFGNSVTCAVFDHLWLNEGFATWVEPLYYENEYGIESYHSYVNSWTVSNTVTLVNPNADNFAGSVAYRRGGMMLHMLRNVLGKEELLEGIRLYLLRKAYDVALTEDFQQALEDSSGQDLDWFFNQWVYQPGRPTYSWGYALRREGSDNVIDLSITQTQSSPMPTVYRMPIDIVVSDLQGNRSTHRVLNDARSQTLSVNVGAFDAWTVELDPDRWILKNEASGSLADSPLVLGASADTLTWDASASPGGFDVITSLDGSVFRVLDRPGGAARSLALGAGAGLATGQTHWLQLRATADGVRPSELTNTYAYREGPGPKVLVVEGYDRWSTQGRGAYHPFAATTGATIGTAGFAFDTCANESLTNGTVSLADYAAVVWVLGEESSATETFSSAEQALVQSYLNGGGRMLVTGAEIAYDLGRSSGPTTADRNFLANYLKAAYSVDDSNSYTATGGAGGVFEGLNFAYDDGSAGIYRAEYPDVIAPANGATTALLYGNGEVAGIQFEGLFPSGSQPGKLVFLGFGFETIHPASTRDAVMARVLQFFDLNPVSTTGDRFMLY